MRLNYIQYRTSNFFFKLGNKFDLHLADSNFEDYFGKVSLHPRKSTHWGAIIDEMCFDSRGCLPLKIKSNREKIGKIPLFRIKNKRE